MEQQNIDLDFEIASAINKKLVVPNKFPSIYTENRLAIVGEAPGADEEKEGEPFVGPSGRLLNGLLSRNNVIRSACFMGNVTQVRPPGNNIELFKWDGEEIQSGLAVLKEDLKKFNPNLVLCLGATALRAFTGDSRSITNWRGSLFWSPEFNVKCLGAYHPAFCIRPPQEGLPLLNMDIRKAASQAASPDLLLPQRTFALDLTALELVERLNQMRYSSCDVSIDIEGYVTDMPCLSFSTDPLSGVIVPFSKEQGINHWDTAEEEAIVWLAVKGILEDEACPKVLQNGLYDRFVLFWSHGILIRNFKWDTMLMHWEKYCELKKSLGLQCSIYTNEPYYKGDRKTQKVRDFRIYCCKDSAVTLEIKQRILPTFTATERHSFDFNMAMQEPLLYMEARGMRFDVDKRNARVGELQVQIDQLNNRITEAVGQELNVKSSKQKKEYLYGTLALPEKFTRATKNKPRAVTTNYEAILTLAKENPDKKELYDIIEVTSLRTRQSALRMGVDPDGRVRCSYNAFKKDEEKGGPTSTGRLACSESATGSGTNLTTIPDHDRDLFQADPGHDMAQCDLSGADTYTVAAHCKRLGDPTMSDDLDFGLKAAKLLVLAIKHGPEIMASKDRSYLAERCKEVPKDDPLYFASKQGVHGSHYKMYKNTLSARIFIESEGKVNIPPALCEKIQMLYFRRYPGVLSWHRWVTSEVRNKRQITSASGHIRRIFGNPNDDAVIRAALSDEPQNNTTYATNKAALNLWLDPENKVGTYHGLGSSDALRRLNEKAGPEGVAYVLGRHDYGSLLIEPLHQIHDALVTQWHTVIRPWAKAKKRAYFQNELIIAGQSIIIPFSGQFGENWYQAGDERNTQII